jgi:superfamily II RNA helicase
MVKICDELYNKHTKYNDKFNKYTFELDHFQKYAIEGIEEGKNILITAHTGSGKCLGYNTPVLMYNGIIKYVQDVKINDLLMGDDSTPRSVIGLARGIEQMYKITLSDGDSFSCNESHILCLKYNVKPFIKNNKKSQIYEVYWFDNVNIKICNKSFSYNKQNIDICFKNANILLNDKIISQKNDYNISVRDYLKLSEFLQRNSSSYKVGVEFTEKHISLDPYIMGIWLGDDNCNSVTITNKDSNILDYLIKNDSEKNIKTILENYNLLNNKHIPNDYKINSRNNRLKLLAGLIDSNCYNYCKRYEIIQENTVLANDIVYLIKSLGFSCKLKKISEGWIYKGEKKTVEYNKIIFSGNNLYEIPILCKRKQCTEEDTINKYTLDYFFKVEDEGIGSYYGFELDGNHKFILGNFIVTHNTLPSEYAIEKFCNEGKKVIYTSPIKSLSNQKFYEFSKKFPEISFGILTGDIKYNPEASCLIMTTEILRNSLFERDNKNKQETNLHFEMDIENELGCVIFDEVHYINDADRGKVWEETIIKIPKHIQIIMLSATIDKSEEFAKWIEEIKEKEVWLASTNIRVVPLTHYVYYQMNQDVYKKSNDKKIELMLKNIDSKIIPIKKQNEKIDYTLIETLQKCSYYLKKIDIYIKQQHVVNNITRYLKKNNMLPALCFVFSRKKCEEYANYIESSLFNEDETSYPNLIEKECKYILRKLPNYHEYINMPEFINMVKLLEKGVAVHHAGVVPVLREMVELLFSKGYIKLLFATETFSVGINMPTKTVIFTSLKKFDGSKIRYLLPHEYTQMAGRAGRRGLDTLGHVIHLNNMFDIPSKTEYNSVLSGNAQTLISKFKIHFNLLLRLISVQNNDITNFIKRSMICNEINKELLYLNKEHMELENKRVIEEENIKLLKTQLDDIKKVYSMREKINMVTSKKRKQMLRDINNIIELNKNFESDYKAYTEYLETVKNVKYIINEINKYETYIQSNIELILNVLSDNEFIKSNEEGKYNYVLTSKGQIANSIQEVNGLCFSELIINNDFDDCTPEQLCGVLASFTNIRVSDEYKTFNIHNDYKYLLDKLTNQYEKYYDIELKTIGYVEEQNYEMNYDINDIVYEWCNCENEEQCKIVINKLYKKDIFVGEFVKALMKINNICCEFEKICDLIGNIKFKNILNKVPELTLKYIATNQSLYI